jgi:hypothetical protein
VWNVAGATRSTSTPTRPGTRASRSGSRRTTRSCWCASRACNDPKTIEQLHATLDATLAKHGEHPGLGFVLGDEVSLTPNGSPFDLCRCGFCEAKWKEYAAKNGLPERAPLTDEVREALLRDDFAQLGPWLAHARFERTDLLEALATLAGRIRAACGRVPVGLLGINGSNAFGGLDLTGGLPFVDFVESYPVNDAREVLAALPERAHRSLRAALAPPRASLATVFVRDETPDGAAWKVWEHWLRGGNGVVLWNDQALAERPAHAARLAAAVARIRGIEHAFPQLMPPSFERVALVHDDDSIALSWLHDALTDGATWPRRRSGYQEEHGTREKSIHSWLRQLEDAGALPVSVPLSRLGEPCFGGCHTLVLAHILVLGPEDVAQLEHQLDLGATLVIDGPLGWVDRSGRPWNEDVLERLRERAPERVRTDIGGLSESLAAWKPIFSAEAGKLPWLIGSRVPRPYFDVVPDERLITALPNPATQEELARLKPVRLEVEAPSGYRIEWIHPASGAELPAGDAAVFLLRRLDDPLPEPR